MSRDFVNSPIGMDYLLDELAAGARGPYAPKYEPEALRHLQSCRWHAAGLG